MKLELYRGEKKNLKILAKIEEKKVDVFVILPFRFLKMAWGKPRGEWRLELGVHRL